MKQRDEANVKRRSRRAAAVTSEQMGHAGCVWKLRGFLYIIV
jgi:hypothetical protein